jgi:hypothetical protein
MAARNKPLRKVRAKYARANRLLRKEDQAQKDLLGKTDSMWDFLENPKSIPDFPKKSNTLKQKQKKAGKESPSGKAKLTYGETGGHEDYEAETWTPTYGSTYVPNEGRLLNAHQFVTSLGKKRATAFRAAYRAERGYTNAPKIKGWND